MNTLVKRDSTFVVDQKTQSTMRHMVVYEQQRNGTKLRITGRDIAMTIQTSYYIMNCYIYQEPGHIMKNYPNNRDAKQQTNAKESDTKAGGGSGKGCLIHRTSSHTNYECYTSEGKIDQAKLSLLNTECAHWSQSSATKGATSSRENASAKKDTSS